MKAIERAARAICEADPTAPDPDAPILWRGKNARAWEARQPLAAAAIRALMFCDAPSDEHPLIEAGIHIGVDAVMVSEAIDKFLGEILGQVAADPAPQANGGV